MKSIFERYSCNIALQRCRRCSAFHGVKSTLKKSYYIYNNSFWQSIDYENRGATPATLQRCEIFKKNKISEI